MTFSTKCHRKKTTAEAGTATGWMKGHFGKGLDEPVALDLCLHPVLSATPGGWGMGLGGPAHPLTFLESTQVYFDFWQQHCVSKSISQSWGHQEPRSLVTFQPEKKSPKDGDSWGLCLQGPPSWPSPIAFACKTLCLEPFAIWIRVPLCYVQFVPQV